MTSYTKRSAEIYLTNYSLEALWAQFIPYLDRFSSSEQEILRSSLCFSYEHHKGQVRKFDGSTPYIDHPVVMALEFLRDIKGKNFVIHLKKENGSAINIHPIHSLCAKLLHDVPEEFAKTLSPISGKSIFSEAQANAKLDEIKNIFGDEIFHINKQVTRAPAKDGVSKYAHELDHAREMDLSGLLCKAYDVRNNTLNNQRYPRHWDLKYKQKFIGAKIAIIELFGDVIDATRKSQNNTQFTNPISRRTRTLFNGIKEFIEWHLYKSEAGLKVVSLKSLSSLPQKTPGQLEAERGREEKRRRDKKITQRDLANAIYHGCNPHTREIA